MFSDDMLGVVGMSEVSMQQVIIGDLSKDEVAEAVEEIRENLTGQVQEHGILYARPHATFARALAQDEEGEVRPALILTVTAYVGIRGNV